MNRRDRVLSALHTLVQQQVSELNALDVLPKGCSALEIAQAAGVTRSNCSGELNALCRLGLVKKVPGRPVYFLPTPTEPAQFSTAGTAALAGVAASSADHVFNKVVGATRSLVEAVRLAKVAVRYPPRGMHTLLLGEAGVGKSMFARTMHEFAVETEQMSSAAPFVAFNCAEYANNPEILLDQLFGHVKGAYTGAVGDKPGLIELAHHGVLFLDEIHRLPPQGQEMLFHWLDTGLFRRMGESANQRRCEALLIAATTETDQSTLLITFRRRIPVTIHLIPLREWSIYDRYELIYRSALEEADTLGVPICLTGSAVDRLLFAHIPGNIGGLRNALKLACARAFAFDYQAGELVVDVNHVQSMEADRISLIANGSTDRVKDIRVTPSGAPRPANTTIFEDSLYAHLTSLADQLHEIGMGQDEIVIAIERELLRRQLNQIAEPSLTELQRFVGDTFYGWMRRSWNTVVHRIDPVVSETAFIRIAMHLSGLTRDEIPSEAQVDASIFHHVQREYPDLWSIAESLLTTFARESGIHLPDHEVALVALLLKPTLRADKVEVGLVLMMRGDSVATQLAETLRQLDNNVHLICVDVPLGAEPSWIIQKASHAIELASMEHGVLVMTDVPAVQQWASSRPRVGCLFRPDLTAVYQAVVAAQTGSHNIDEIVDAVYRGYSNRSGEIPPARKRQVWTCCMTGRGSAMALKRLIEHALPSEWLNQIEIVPVEVAPNGVASAAVGPDLIATVGSVRPNIEGIPFLSVEELLAPGGVQRLVNVISQFHPSWKPATRERVSAATSSSRGMRAYIESMLEKDLTVVNPKLALTVADEAVSILGQKTQMDFNEAWFARFAIHMAYVVERNVRGTPLHHADTQALMVQQRQLWSDVREALTAYEKWFQIELTEGEIAYVFNMMLTDNVQEMSLS